MRNDISREHIDAVYDLLVKTYPRTASVLSGEDINCVRRTIRWCLEREFADREAIRFVACTEEFNPSLSEEFALYRMNQIERRVEARTGRKLDKIKPAKTQDESEAPPRLMLVGLSVSACIQDIVEQKVDIEDVAFIVPGFILNEQNTIGDVCARYKQTHWSKYPDLAESVLKRVRIKPHPGNFPNICGGNWMPLKYYSTSLSLRYNQHLKYTAQELQDLRNGNEKVSSPTTFLVTYVQRFNRTATETFAAESEEQAREFAELSIEGGAAEQLLDGQALRDGEIEVLEISQQSPPVKANDVW